MEKEQLQAELDTVNRLSRAKDQQISDLKEGLCGMQEKLMALREDNKQQEMIITTQQQEMNQQKLLAASTTGL